MGRHVFGGTRGRMHDLYILDYCITGLPMTSFVSARHRAIHESVERGAIVELRDTSGVSYGRYCNGRRVKALLDLPSNTTR